MIGLLIFSVTLFSLWLNGATDTSSYGEVSALDVSFVPLRHEAKSSNGEKCEAASYFSSYRRMVFLDLSSSPHKSLTIFHNLFWIWCFNGSIKIIKAPFSWMFEFYFLWSHVHTNQPPPTYTILLIIGEPHPQASLWKVQ